MKMKKVFAGILKAGVFFGSIGGVAYLGKKSMQKEAELGKRYRSYYTVTNQWLMNKNENKDMSKYFEENKIKTIAIYGMGSMGELFYEDIKKTNVEVAYFIDKNADELYYGLDDISVVNLDGISDQKKVDAIIVTPVFDFDKISDDLEEAGADAEIISLEDVIYEM